MRQDIFFERGMRMYLVLAEDERLALSALAIQERRSMREQAAYLLRLKLEELGELPAKGTDGAGG